MQTAIPHIPAFLRRKIGQLNLTSASSWRESSLAQLWLCGMLGIAVSMVTILLHDLVLASNRLLFALPKDTSLSETTDIKPLSIVIIPVLGGLILVACNRVIKKWRSNEIVDPIEANAVHGGRMSIRDSARLVFSTLLSNASGVSIGMEAAYTQAGSGIMSWVGQRLNLRREDLRIFVAAGSAAAIAAAFNAPLAGAFYGFELVLGIYTIRALPQVAIAAVSSVVFMRLFTHSNPIFFSPMENIDIPLWHYFLFLGMGILAARIGIFMMKLVTHCENICRKFSIPTMLRPALGGLLVGLIALAFPQVLGSGQGAINNHLHSSWPILLLAMLLVAKIAASAISIGSGFRGGLFSAALFIGCLYGQLCGDIAAFFLPEDQADLICFMLVGMGAITASIVGAPVTIILLVLEMTESFTATTPVLAAVLISSIITRHSFGYSFSTWRFHVRGLRINGAFDIGWIAEMTVRQLMNANFKTTSSDASLEELRATLPLSDAKKVFLVNEDGHYQGILDIFALHNAEIDKEEISLNAQALATGKDCYLLPSQNIQEAINLFAKWEMEELPVLAAPDNPEIIGSLSESYVLKRYAKELEMRNLAQSGAAAPPEKAIQS